MSADPGVAVAVCARCRHRRSRPSLVLFDERDLASPGGLKAKLEWEETLRQRRLTEMQRFSAGEPFDYEPFHYDWCQAWTDELDPGAPVVEPVSGRPIRGYALCQRMNPDAACPRFEPA